MNFLEKALEYIFLPSCGICGELGNGYLCNKCGKELEKYKIDEYTILYNKEVGDSIEKMHIFKYEDMVRKMLLQYKFNDKSYLYKTFCEIVVNNKKIFDFIKTYDIIIPVPMHKVRIKERGYNQSELISKEISKNSSIKMYKDVLIKIKNNKIQSKLKGKDRVENTKNVYKLINAEKINNRKVLIFDDIYTTGATINACISEIAKANPSKIGILTLAKD